MIKIQEHLNKTSIDIYLDNLVTKHWEELNPKKNNGEYKESSLMKKCKKYYDLTNTVKYVENYADNLKYVAKRHRRFFKYLKKNHYENLKKIITAKPDEFDTLKSDITSILDDSDLFFTQKGKVCQTSFGKLISNNFLNYNNFRTSDYCIELYKSLSFENCTCPYCNDNKVKIVNKNNSTNDILYFELDHFYPKSKNPFFALSLFNLIPSCTTCNSNEKGDEDFTINTHIHPYYESFNDLYKFEVSTTSFLTAQVDDFKLNNKQIKPNDLTVNDLNLFNRYTHNIEKIEKLIKFYLNYYRKDPNELNEIIIEALNVPKTIFEILKKENGKLLRDIALQIDESNNLLDLE